MRASAVIVPFLLIIQVSSGLNAQPIVKYAGSDSTLDGHWQWALQQSSRLGGSKGYWIGYSIERLMDESSFISSGKGSTHRLMSQPALEDLIQGDTIQKPPEGLRMHESSIFKKMKNVAFMFLTSLGSDGGSEIAEMEICTMDLSFNLGGRSVAWLGSSNDDESVRFLERMFDQSNNLPLKKEIVVAIGLHQRSDEPSVFLSRVLSGTEPDEVREKAAFWLSQQDDKNSLAVLGSVARNDKALNVRRQAVFAIGCMDTDSSTDTLIALAQTAEDAKVRGKAAFWLGQKASKKVVAALENIVTDDQVTEVQRQALFGLWQMKDSGSVERLIHIAETHPNPRIRKQAIELLGQSDDPKAVAALIAIVKK